ncbi:hypothetical protein HYQ46_003504 [Verticillium longisporum]|uniref:Uncharacterized protein n=1 Tax=Verticillium dahliae (strain VdLs.17 / ATCC MYA-4575 / FGSC 10137) TaxID=498257 RepID=G2X3D1_VERDV|nr:uncharacterized protein VDAG_04916 [Verticillium dahliae VdLs.17]EGY23478.1 hypothetical protein VDAG_04916 [Verticillium dahliae VdLs.17]KAG7152916.1 hypothetical protein HYQ46_003504 [Verticillium longisporum]KAH6708501.1 hypothetical protein EV126DRAFT_112612 [Verticillium dahliae]
MSSQAFLPSTRQFPTPVTYAQSMFEHTVQQMTAKSIPYASPGNITETRFRRKLPLTVSSELREAQLSLIRHPQQRMQHQVLPATRQSASLAPQAHSYSTANSPTREGIQRKDEPRRL